MWRKVVSHYAGNHLPVIHRDTPKIQLKYGSVKDVKDKWVYKKSKMGIQKIHE